MTKILNFAQKKFDVNAINNEIFKSKEIFIEKRNSLTIEKIYKKNFNVNLKSTKNEFSTINDKYQNNQKFNEKFVNNRIFKFNNRFAFDEKHVFLKNDFKCFALSTFFLNDSIYQINQL